jgi:hypothetical protein
MDFAYLPHGNVGGHGHDMTCVLKYGHVSVQCSLK